MGGRVRGAEATATTHGDENEEGKTRGGLARRGSLDGPPASGGFASTTSVDDDWRGVGDNRSENRPDDEENDERDGGDAEMLDEGDDDDDEGDEDDDASDVRFIDRGAGEASTPRHADGTFGLINSFVKNVFRAPRAVCVFSNLESRTVDFRVDDETDECSTRGLTHPFLLLDRRPVLDLPRRRYRGTRGTYTMRTMRTTTDGDDDRDARTGRDGTERRK